MLKSIKQTLERSREENIDAITVILNKREQDYHTTIEKLGIRTSSIIITILKILLVKSKYNIK